MTQPELPLEYHHYDHYRVELRRGQLHAEETVRSHTAKTRDDALNFIEALRDTAKQRNNVAWTGEEVDAAGYLYGMDPEGLVWLVVVVPSLTVELG